MTLGVVADVNQRVARVLRKLDVLEERGRA